MNDTYKDFDLNMDCAKIALDDLASWSVYNGDVYLDEIHDIQKKLEMLKLKADEERTIEGMQADERANS